MSTKLRILKISLTADEIQWWVVFPFNSSICCGLLSSMWNHIEECHSEEEDWFDETFSSRFLDIWCRSLGVINPTGNFHFVRASVPQRLALPASNVAVGSVINLDFPILYVLNGNKELILSDIQLLKGIVSFSPASQVMPHMTCHEESLLCKFITDCVHLWVDLCNKRTIHSNQG